MNFAMLSGEDTVYSRIGSQRLKDGSDHIRLHADAMYHTISAGKRVVNVLRGKFRDWIPQEPFVTACLAGSLLFFLFFRANYALTGNYVSFETFSDDATYVHYLILFSDSLGVTSGITDGWLEAARQYAGPHPPGIALAWLPAAVVARIIHVLGSLSYADLLMASIGVLNWFYFCLSMFLFLKFVKSAISPGIALPVFLTVPVLYYASHRATMTHPFEAVLVLLFLSSLVQPGENTRSVLFQLLLLCCLATVRYQYVLMIPVFGLLLIGQKSPANREQPGTSFLNPRYAITLVFFAAGAFAVYAFWPSTYFSKMTLKQMMTFHTVSYRWLYSWMIPLIDPSWGILFLSGGACVMIFKSLGNGIRNRQPWNWKQKFMLVWIAYFYIVAWIFGKQGDDIQYRFLNPLIVSAPFLLMIFEVKNIEKSKLFRILNVGSCGLTLLVIWLVKTREIYTLTLHRTNLWMAEGWHNYWLIPKMIYGVLTNPVDLVRPLALSPLGTLIITVLPHEAVRKYSLEPIPFATLVLMVLVHLCFCVWAGRRLLRGI